MGEGETEHDSNVEEEERNSVEAEREAAKTEEVKADHGMKQQRALQRMVSYWLAFILKYLPKK